jgi:hypothetical protein
MKKTAAYVLLLVAAAALRLAAQTHPVTPSVETADQGSGIQSSKKIKENRALPSIPSSMVLDKNVKFESYEVRTYRADENGGPLQAFEILKSGRRIYSRIDDNGVKYNIGCINENDEGNLEIRPGKDITGTGKPNLVISDWSGGAHCCLTYYIFELNDHVREVGRINAEHGSVCRFQEERDGKVDFIIHDWTFAYWKTSFAESPAPQIILRYHPGGYKVATDLMATANPSREEFQQLVDKGRRIPPNDEGQPTSGFWEIMLNLIYSGHADLAWRFCDEAWPGSATAKKQFLESFKYQLSQSPYWQAIKAMNGL